MSSFYRPKKKIGWEARKFRSLESGYCEPKFRFIWISEKVMMEKMRTGISAYINKDI